MLHIHSGIFSANDARDQKHTYTHTHTQTRILTSIVVTINTPILLHTHHGHGHGHGVFILATSSKGKWTTNPTPSHTNTHINTGIFLLVTRVTKKTRSVQGLSLKTQLLYLCVFATRLMFKIFYEKDYTYAAVETFATLLTAYLVVLIRIQYRYSPLYVWKLIRLVLASACVKINTFGTCLCLWKSIRLVLASVCVKINTFGTRLCMCEN